MDSGKSPEGRDVDAGLIRSRYEQERVKRLNAAATRQYNFTEGNFAFFAEDPYTHAPTPRDAITEDLDFLIIGAGIGGIQLGKSLLDNGIRNFRMLDVAGDFGGTWYWNRYPGLRCDVESYIYLPLLEFTGFVPPEKYVTGKLIFDYLKLLSGKIGLPDHALFQTKVAGMTWDDQSGRWFVTTNRGDTFRTRFVSTQSGLFNRPQLPGIPGIDQFQGKMFHSARWDYAYTGGSPETPMDKLGDKRVGIIGTGTTAIQVVPQLARAAKEVVVFQRTPSSVGARNNAPTDVEWFKSQPKGWQKKRSHGFNALSMGEHSDCGIDDGWTRYFKLMIKAVDELPVDQRTAEQIAAAQEQADFALNEDIRQRVDSIVTDRKAADVLKAYYRTMCKRPGFSDEYLQVFNQDNVQLVDVSQGKVVITPKGVSVNGVEYELDCLVFCTGFEIATSWAHQAGYDVVGADGVRLSEKWADGPLTYHGLFSHDFPNLFFMGVTQTAATINLPHMLQEQADHLTFVVKHCLDRNYKKVEATAEAENEWQAELRENVKLRRSFQNSCTPSYYNGEGDIEDRKNVIGNGWYMPSTRFFEMWQKWRNNGQFEGLHIS